MVPVPAATSFTADAQAAQSQLNTYRKANGLGSLILDPTLTRVAQNLASTCGAAAGKCDHNTGGSFQSRLRAAGYGAGYGAENLRNDTSVQGAFAWWKGSQIHNGNMLMKPVTRMGFAAGKGKSARTTYVLIVAGEP